MGVFLLLVTSCVAPDGRRTGDRPAAVNDAKQLVRLLAPGLSEHDIAALPDQAPAAPAAAVAASPFLAQAASLDDAARARDCLTAAVYYEARSEPAEGQRAVAQVVLNRVRDRAFPHSVCGVVYQGVGSGRGCQFSFACDGSMDRPREPDAWGRAERVAIAALNGGVMAAVGNATFYHASYVLPWWASSLTRLGAVGSHIFYRWPGALERALGMRATYAGVEPGMPAARAEAGVNVVRGGDFGVTVHRGSDATATATATAAASPTPLAASTIRAVHIGIAVRMPIAGGVRVHRGEDAPVAVDSSSSDS